MLEDIGSREAANEKAKALVDSGQFAEANAIYLRLSEQYPNGRHHKTNYARTAIEVCRTLAKPDERRKELSVYVIANIANGDEKDRAHALRFLALLGAVQKGAELLLKIEKQCSTLRDIDTCFRFIPRFIERGARGPLWRSLHGRLRKMRDSLPDEQRAESIELDLKLLLAMERFPEYIDFFQKRRDRLTGSENLERFKRVYGRLLQPRAEVFAEPKVFGIGLSRTGTTSLTGALIHLGIDAAHWTNPLTHQVLADMDFFLFGASTDCSVSPEFEKLYYLYPNAQFVYTRRDIDAWEQSFWSHHRRVSWAGDMESFRRAYSQRPFPDAAVEFALYMQGPEIRDSYRAFDARVRGFFANKPNGKLLELDIAAGEGWPELCAFLNKPVPDAPFPKLNASETA